MNCKPGQRCGRRYFMVGRQWSVAFAFFFAAMCLTGCGTDDRPTNAPPAARTCVDYAESAHLVRILPEARGKSLAYNRDLVYVASNLEPEFSIVDVSDQAHPRIVCSLRDVPGGPYKIACAGTRVAIGTLGDNPDWVEKLLVYDVSDPAAPSLIVERNLHCLPSLAFTDSTLMYTECGQDGSFTLQIVRTPDSDALAPIGTLQLDGGVGDIEVYGRHAYLAGDGLRVIDISDPMTPRVVGNVATPGGIGSLACDGPYVFASDGYGVRSFDVTRPETPVELDSESVSSPNGVRGMALYGKYALTCGSYSGLAMVDRADPRNLETAVVIQARREAFDVVRAGGFACVVTTHEGLCIYDLGSQATSEAMICQGGPGDDDIIVDLEPISRDFVVASRGGTVARMALSSDGQLQTLAQVEIGHEISDVAIVDSLIACLESGQPTELVRLTAAGALESGRPLIVTGRAVVALGGYLYLGGANGLYTVDVSADPEPRVVDRLEGIAIESLQAHNGTLWALQGWRTLTAISVGDPVHPAIAGQLTIPQSTEPGEKGLAERYLALIDDVGFLAQSDRVLVLDLSVPETPMITGAFVVPQVNWVHSLSAVDGLLVVACEYGGQHLFEVSDPLRPVGIGFRDTGLDKACALAGYHVLFGHQFDYEQEPLQVWLRDCLN